MSYIDETTRAALNGAMLLQNRIDELQAEQNRILKPLVDQAVERNYRPYTQELLNEMPKGAWRSELMSWHNGEMGKYEYRIQGTGQF